MKEEKLSDKECYQFVYQILNDEINKLEKENNKLRSEIKLLQNILQKKNEEIKQLSKRK